MRSMMSTLFRAGDVEYAVLAVDGINPHRDEHRWRLDSLAAAIGSVPGVARVRYHREGRDSLLAGRDGALVLAALDSSAGSGDGVIRELRATTEAIAKRWNESTITMRWTGEPALNADLRRTNSADAARAERRALPLTLLILLAVFGTVQAAGLPVAVGVLTIGCALGIATLAGRVFSLSLMLQSLVTMVGLGLGIDYGLLMVSRFREALDQGLSATGAARHATRYGGRTIMVSGVAVMMGFGGLTLVPLGELQSLGAGGLMTVACAVLVSVTLLPGLLAMLGRNINRWPVAPRIKPGTGHWRAWGEWVCRHPWIALSAAGAPLLWLSWQATGMTVGNPEEDWLPPAMESTQGLRLVEGMGRSALLQRARVLVRLPTGSDVLASTGWGTVKRIHERIESDDRISHVVSFSSFARERPPSRLMFLATPRALRHAYVSENREAVLLEGIPRETVSPGTMVDWVEEFRSAVQTDTVDAQVWVGGLPAVRADYQRSVLSALPRVVAVVLIGTFLALALSFRSILIPAKALMLNLVSVAGGFGVAKLVFLDGIGLSVIGLAEPVSSVFPVIPALVFCTVFGLSMDYEIFLVARVAEFKNAEASERAAIACGLAHSAPLISSASAVMVVVFGAFAFGQFLVIKMLGVALAASIFLDATLVRMAVGPALLALAGRWNWWPGIRGTSHA
jgi:RND superfamily putative drug exporter